MREEGGGKENGFWDWVGKTHLEEEVVGVEKVKRPERQQWQR